MSNELSHSCEGNKNTLTIESTADNSLKLEDMLFVEILRISAWEERHKLHNFDSNSFNTLMFS